MSDLAKFASDVEKAFLLVGGEESKKTYDWMIAKATEERIIKLLEETLKFEPWEGIFRRNPTNPEEGRALDVEELIALIKGETE